MSHQWESGPGWGVIVGVSRCLTCGCVSRRDNLNSTCPGSQPR